MADSPQIGARQLQALRTRTFTQAGKALATLADITSVHRREFDAGQVPGAAGLRKAADKYLGLLATLDIADSLLTPEALEAMHAEDGDGVVVSRGDLAPFVALLRGTGLVPRTVPEDTPLGRLSAAAGSPVPPEVVKLAAVPEGDPGYGPWVTAGFDGECDDCGAPVSEGDSIRSDGAGGWLCASCGDG